MKSSDLSDKIWWTRKSKIQAEKRLLNNASHAQALLFWYSFFSVGAAVYYLKFSTESQYSNVAWIVFSTLIVSISGFINGLSYKERASLIKNSYEILGKLYQRAIEPSPDIKEIAMEYEQILGVCENHAGIDYYKALCETYLIDNAENLDRKPTAYIWFSIIIYRVKRFLLLAGLYISPIVLFVIMEYGSVCTGTI
jgi:hypothetical protein